MFQINNNWKNILYVHTPFCKQKCFYCVYSSKVPSESGELDLFYKKYLKPQIISISDALENKTFDELYFGGGTPTIVGADRLYDIYESIPNFRKIKLKATEASPYTLTQGHIELFHEFRFDYVSMGIQTTNEMLLKQQNRLYISNERLIEICRAFDEYDITCNMDLIFYLESGNQQDLIQARLDLEFLLSVLRPTSITIHSNYRVEKKVENQRKMIITIKDLIEKYSEYTCVNSILDENEAEIDLMNAAEYRLMRAKRDFNFYMLPKYPDSHTYGYNMLSVGKYGEFQPKFNYFYLFDGVDKYALLARLTKLKRRMMNYNDLRNKLRLAANTFIPEEDFFMNENNKNLFEELMIKNGLPVYDFSVINQV